MVTPHLKFVPSYTFICNITIASVRAWHYVTAARLKFAALYIYILLVN